MKNYQNNIEDLEIFRKYFANTIDIPTDKNGDMVFAFKPIAMVISELITLLEIINESLLKHNRLAQMAERIMRDSKVRINQTYEEQEIVDDYLSNYPRFSVLIKAVYEWLYHLQEVISKSKVPEFKSIWGEHYDKNKKIQDIRETRNKLIGHYSGDSVPLVTEVGFDNNLPYVFMYPSAFNGKPRKEDYLNTESQALDKLESLCEDFQIINVLDPVNKIRLLCENYLGEKSVQRWLRKYGGLIILDNGTIRPFLNLLEDIKKKNYGA